MVYYALGGPIHDIFEIMDWSSKWLVELHYNERHVISYGCFVRSSYFLDRAKSRPVQFSDEDRDLCVVFNTFF